MGMAAFHQFGLGLRKPHYGDFSMAKRRWPSISSR
jgi:hypothetical protein